MKYALFTGAAGGIASACVEALDKKGDWTIFAADFRAPSDEVMKKWSSNVIPIQFDITNQEDCFRAAEEVKKHTDHLDAIINCAGMHTMCSLIEGDPAPVIQKMLEVNLLGMMKVNKAFFELINACKGRIINFSSECGWEKPQPFNTPYAITKYAVEAYTIGLRRELKFIDVPVIKIQPGSFKTGMHTQAMDGYTKVYNSTKLYKDVLGVLSPLMKIALAHPNEMHYLTETVTEAICAENPKTNYKCKNTWYLVLIDPIPDKIIDSAYKLVVGIGAKFIRQK